MRRFTILNGPEAGQTFDVEKDRFVIGREAGRDLVLEDDRVSRSHVALEVRGGALFVVDMGSSNGAFVNDQMVFEQELHEGDVLTVGHTQMRYGEPLSPADAARASGGGEAQTVLGAADGWRTISLGQQVASSPDAEGATVIGLTDGEQSAAAPDAEGATVIGLSDGEQSAAAPDAEGATVIGLGDGEQAAPAPDAEGPWRRAFPADASSIGAISNFMRDFASAAGLGDRGANELDIAMRQICSMVFRQAAARVAGEITVACREEGDRVFADIRYPGPPLAPEQADGSGSTDKYPTMMLAPLGVDSQDYRREGDINVISITKRRDGDGGSR